jgi:hypothetical protein
LGDIYVGRTNQDGPEPAATSIRRGLVYFDLAASIPAGALISQVTLTMRFDRGLNGDPTLHLHRVLQDWGEAGSFFDGGLGAAATDGDATWLHTFYNAAQPGSSPTWNQPGGDFQQSPSAVSKIVGELGEGQLVSWSSDAMVADVQSWLGDSDTNFGWILLGDETRGRSVKRFDSRESFELPDLPPMLMIEYTSILAGDYTDDGIVDVADYVVWRKHLDQMITLENEAATPGQVTPEDYNVWKSNFSAPQSQANGAASVPEPHFATMAVAAILYRLNIARFRNRYVA